MNRRFARSAVRSSAKATAGIGEDMNSLRRTNRWGWTAALTLLWALAWLFGGLLFVLPAVALTLPALLGYMGVKAGPVCYAGCAALAVAFMGWLLGAQAALVVALVLLPASAFALIAMDRGIAYAKAAGIGAALLLLCGGLALLLGSAVAGGDLVGGLIGALETLLPHMPQTDMMLFSMYQNGLFTLPEGMEAVQQAGEYAQLTDAARAELTRSLMLYLDGSLRLAMPAQWVTGSILGGLLLALLPRYAARQRGEAVDFTPLRSLSLPKGTVRLLGATLGVLLLLGLTGAGTFASALYVVWEAACLIVSLQGLAVIDFHAHAHGVRRGGRAALIVGAFVLTNLLGLTLILPGLGLLDEFIGLRGQKKIPFPPDGGDDGEDDF